MDKEEIRELIETSHVIELMRELGDEDYIEDSEGVLRFTTKLCHGGDSRKLYYYPDSKTFHCYTQCSCSYDIFGFIQKVKNCSFGYALRTMCNIMNIDTGGNVRIGFESKLIDDWKILRKYQKKNIREDRISVLPTFNKGVLNIFRDWIYEGWIKEGISIDSCIKYDIKYDIWRNKIIIPHFDKLSNLVGIRGRSLNPEEIEMGFKYLPLVVEDTDYRHEIRYNLYGIHLNADKIRRCKKVMLVESEKSVLQCDTFFGEDCFVLATCGSSLSRYQRDMLIELGVEEVIVAYDKEYTHEDCINGTEKYMKYMSKIQNLCDMLTPYFSTFVLWDVEDLLNEKDSPTDRGKEILIKLMKSKQKVLTKDEE